jgi:hypothetical protein
VSRGKGRTTLALVKAAQEILAEIAPASVRAVCYRLFAAGHLPNMEKSATNGVSRKLTWAREEGLIKWADIVDETRRVEQEASWRNPDELIRAAVAQYRRDNWIEQPLRVEVWSEKGTIRGTLAPVLDAYGVPFRVMRGYSSATVIHGIAEETCSSDKPLVAFYVGDWDPSGKHMSDVDLPGRLLRYGGDVQLQRIALTTEHLHNLPDFDPETKKADPRHRWFVETIATRCYELDALPPPRLREIVRTHVLACIDLAAWNRARDVEAVEVESIRKFYKSWLATKCEVRP